MERMGEVDDVCAAVHVHERMRRGVCVCVRALVGSGRMCVRATALMMCGGWVFRMGALPASGKSHGQ